MEFRAKDKLLQAVLKEPVLCKFGEYEPDDYQTVDDAIEADNEVVSAVGRIIERQSSNVSDKDIYREVCNHLR
ncbi:MAG: hypothetical protein MJZ23_02210 [Paludibacteraceae bacterium]|nr:hypothetical protein [Paludibacteraceae bacterium]